MGRAAECVPVAVFKVVPPSPSTQRQTTAGQTPSHSIGRESDSFTRGIGVVLLAAAPAGRASPAFFVVAGRGCHRDTCAESTHTHTHTHTPDARAQSGGGHRLAISSRPATTARARPQIRRATAQDVRTLMMHPHPLIGRASSRPAVPSALRRLPSRCLSGLSQGNAVGLRPRPPPQRKLETWRWWRSCRAYALAKWMGAACLRP